MAKTLVSLSFVMLNLFQHPLCLLARTGPVEKWTLKQVQGDDRGCGELRFHPTKFFALPLLLSLAACKVAEDPQAAAEEAREDAGGTTIACAQGQAEYAQDCWYERSDEDGKRLLVIHHPDGSFRRFEIVDDGRGLVAADGADAAQVTVAGEVIEVSLADYRYLVPATVQGADARE